MPRTVVYLDEFDGEESTNIEKEADAFAADFLVPPQYRATIAQLTSRQEVVSFAQEINLHPGIVVGRLQHDGVIPHAWLNNLKQPIA